jgi:hypothetical protein
MHVHVLTPLASELEAALGDGPEHEDDTCRVISGHYALLVQAFLAAMVLGTLLYKRLQESPRRSWTIWLMDTSKQGFAMSLQHIVNLALAIFFARSTTRAGECIWYAANFTITVVCGLVLLTGYMKVHRIAVERYDLQILVSGEYGDPPSAKVWFVQMALWCFVASAEKFITAGCVIMPLRHVIDRNIAEMEVPMKQYPRLELILVMVVVPTFLNVVFVWVCDNLIKKTAVKCDELSGGIPCKA